MIGTNFPISDYYKENIVDAKTISRRGGWWTAIILTKDPKNDKLKIILYKWQLRGNGWKTRKSFIFKSVKEITTIFKIVKKFSQDFDN